MSPSPDTGPGAARPRIAKHISRSGRASRREAERLIGEGRVTLAGRRVETPATLVGPDDEVCVDGRPLPAAQPMRLFLHNKPAGLVVTRSDERGRPTVFDRLPGDLPVVMAVGRLDIASEGLLLLTTNGELKRRLELPATGWRRRYRVRVRGAPEEAALAPLRTGITVAGERFRPMDVAVERQLGANAWLSLALREGRNREVRRALEAVGLRVNRLIRVAYGPFQLGDLAAGGVREVPGHVMREQLGRLAEPAHGSAGRGRD